VEQEVQAEELQLRVSVGVVWTITMVNGTNILTNVGCIWGVRGQSTSVVSICMIWRARLWISGLEASDHCHTASRHAARRPSTGSGAIDWYCAHIQFIFHRYPVPTVTAATDNRNHELHACEAHDAHTLHMDLQFVDWIPINAFNIRRLICPRYINVTRTSEKLKTAGCWCCPSSFQCWNPAVVPSRTRGSTVQRSTTRKLHVYDDYIIYTPLHSRLFFNFFLSSCVYVFRGGRQNIQAYSKPLDVA